MTKQEAIQQAYGKDYELVKDYLRPHGWCPVDEFSVFTAYQELPKDLYELKSGGHFIRPISISGIETNNGWTKIESDDDLPDENGLYITCGLYLFSENNTRRFERSRDFVFENGEWKSTNMEICFHFKVTHWHPIESIPYPIY